MRVNKYRAKRTKDEEWVYGSLVNIGRKKKAIINNADFDWSEDYAPRNDDGEYTLIGDVYEVIPDTVCQFIGIMYFGREIYEHDLIRCGGILYEIVFKEEFSCFLLRQVLNNGIMAPITLFLNGVNCEYIGNIFDDIGKVKLK